MMALEYHPSSHDASASDIESRLDEYIPAHGTTVERSSSAAISVSRDIDFTVADIVAIDSALHSLGYLRR